MCLFKCGIQNDLIYLLLYLEKIFEEWDKKWYFFKVFNMDGLSFGEFPFLKWYSRSIGLKDTIIKHNELYEKSVIKLFY